jgi:hypothetical protein
MRSPQGIVDPKYREHDVFGQLARCVEFYDALSMSETGRLIEPGMWPDSNASRESTFYQHEGRVAHFGSVSLPE